jgi:hypothetical protein
MSAARPTPPLASEADVEREMIRALMAADWERVLQLYNDAGLLHSHTLARLGRKFGISEEIAQRMLALWQEEIDWEPPCGKSSASGPT